MASLQANDLYICSVVRAELLFGALHSADPTHNWTLVERFCRRFVSLPFEDRTADTYAIVREKLAGAGQVIGPHDLLIAAIVLTHSAILVTHNTREFERVEGLDVEDWERSGTG